MKWLVEGARNLTAVPWVAACCLAVATATSVFCAAPLQAATPPYYDINYDYDGDHIADLAVFRRDFPWAGATSFLVLPSSGANLAAPPNLGGWTAYAGGYYKQWGLNGDIPLPGDYSGLGITDCAVFRPSSGTWCLAYSCGGTFILQYGLPTDCPAPQTLYSLDLKRDICLYRYSENRWYQRDSSTLIEDTYNCCPLPPNTVSAIPSMRYSGYNGWRDMYIKYYVNGQQAIAWQPADSTNPDYFVTGAGVHNDIAIAGRYSYPNIDDFVRFRPSSCQWLIKPYGGPPETVTTWGQSGDIPVAGDYDGDGLTDIAVWRPSNGCWYVIPSKGQVIPGWTPIGGGPGCYRQWGLPGDIPLGRPLNQGY